jgi:glycosyltransferase involved in cell wall biosynthesis
MIGFVEDIDAFFDGAAVSLCPYRFGGGVKIKVLEALARACPVVTTTVGCEGLGVSNGEHLAIADRTIGFADAIVRLLNDPALARQLGLAGHAHVARNFSFRSKTAHLKQVIDGLTKRPREAFINHTTST